MANIKDVAKAAGVSAMTVSRYFNRPEKLSPETRERVREAVKNFSYIPNSAAETLFKGTSKILALILSDITNPFFTTLARGAEDVANDSSYMLILGNTDETLYKERRYLELALAKRVDGMVLAPAPGEEHNLDLLVKHGIPTVLIDRRVLGASFDSVRGDSRTGGYELTKHLIERGRQKISFIGGPAGVTSLEDRLEGYLCALGSVGLKPRVRLGRYDYSSGRDITCALLAESTVPDALVAANNLVAAGAMSVLREYRMRVPEDVAVVAFDDLNAACPTEPFLTTVIQPAYDIGARAVRMLLERIKGLHTPARDVVLPVEILYRGST